VTQGALGERAGLNDNMWGDVERGERNTALKRLLKIAQVLGVEPRKLFIIEQEEPSATKRRTMNQDACRRRTGKNCSWPTSC